MSLKVMADNQIEITAKQDGALYNVVCGNQDFIIEGLGGEFAMTNAGLAVTIESGEAILHGRHVTADSANNITLPANESGYLVLRIDLSEVVGQEASLFATPAPVREEINWGGVIYDLVLASFTTNTTSVTNFEDLRIKTTSAIDLALKPLSDLIGGND